MTTTITTAPPIAGRQIKHIRVIIGTTDFAAQVNKCDFKKGGGQTQTWQGGTPTAQYIGKSPDEYTCDLGFIADWEQEESLCNYLYEHDGEKASIEYMPFADGTVFFTSELTISAPAPPGTVGNWAEVELSMPCTKPTRQRKPVPPKGA